MTTHNKQDSINFDELEKKPLLQSMQNGLTNLLASNKTEPIKASPGSINRCSTCSIKRGNTFMWPIIFIGIGYLTGFNMYTSSIDNKINVLTVSIKRVTALAIKTKNEQIRHTVLMKIIENNLQIK